MITSTVFVIREGAAKTPLTLNHKLGTIQTGGEISAVAAIYNRHLYLDEMREAIQKWETHLASLLAQRTLSTKAA